MPIFVCEQCLHLENTATSNFIVNEVSNPQGPRMCSLCDPQIGRWHGRFERVVYDPTQHADEVAYPPRPPFAAS